MKVVHALLCVRLGWYHEGSLQADTDEERRRAWEFGLSSDGQQEWSRRVEELRAYRQQYGDAHVGFRDNDAPELTRWAAKQRSDWRAGDLREDRQGQCQPPEQLCIRSTNNANLRFPKDVWSCVPKTICLMRLAAHMDQAKATASIHLLS